MRQINEKHTWFNLDKNNEGCILRYTTKDGSMLSNEYIQFFDGYTNQVALHKYGVIVIKQPLTSIGHGVFYGCIGLTSIVIPDSVTRIGISAFQNCIDLTSITIPNSATRIETDAFFNCTELSSVIIPNNVILIGEMAFYGCEGLTSLTIHNSVYSIGRYAFEKCSSLTNVIYKGTKAEFNAIQIRDKVFDKGVKIHCTNGDITI